MFDIHIQKEDEEINILADINCKYCDILDIMLEVCGIPTFSI